MVFLNLSKNAFVVCIKRFFFGHLVIDAFFLILYIVIDLLHPILIEFPNNEKKQVPQLLESQLLTTHTSPHLL
jgi:hypothetical protein